MSKMRDAGRFDCRRLLRCLAWTATSATCLLTPAVVNGRPADAAPHADANHRGVQEVHVVARKFQFTPSIIHVVAGEPVRLVLSSMDSVHGFAIPELKIDVQIPKGGEAVTVAFVAPAAGRYDIACSEFCGRGHADMKAALVSTVPEQSSR